MRSVLDNLRMVMVIGLAVVATGGGGHGVSLALSDARGDVSSQTRPPPAARLGGRSAVPDAEWAQRHGPTLKRPGSVHEFYFTRARYGNGAGSRAGSRYTPSWATDFPKADIQFLIGLKRLTNIDAYEWENPIDLDDPDLRRYPFLYALEVGYMGLSEAEVDGLRSYLLAGGFLMIDDFWGGFQWDNFEQEIRRVLPEYPIVDLPSDHPIFSVFYNIGQIVQVPNVGQGRSGGPTWEWDGYVPHVRGIFDETGRLLVIINWNTDLGDAWEWADDPYYPIKYSTFAYEMGINTIIYAMSH